MTSTIFRETEIAMFSFGKMTLPAKIIVSVKHLPKEVSETRFSIYINTAKGAITPIIVKLHPPSCELFDDKYIVIIMDDDMNDCCFLIKKQQRCV